MTLTLKMDYVEFASSDFDATEEFFAQAFGWEFVNYGPDYRDIQKAGIGGGLERATTRAPHLISNNMTQYLPIFSTQSISNHTLFVFTSYRYKCIT